MRAYGSLWQPMAGGWRGGGVAWSTGRRLARWRASVPLLLFGPGTCFIANSIKGAHAVPALASLGGRRGPQATLVQLLGPSWLA